MDELRECPFCGSRNLEYDVAGFVSCNDCGADGPSGGVEQWTDECLAAAWNHRASPWISVENALPDGYYNVIIAGGIGYYCDNKWWSNTGDDAHREIQWEVTHWMPIPSAPEVE